MVATRALFVSQLGEVKLEQERKKHEVELNRLSVEIEELKKTEKTNFNSEFSQLRADIEHLKKVRRIYICYGGYGWQATNKTLYALHSYSYTPTSKKKIYEIL